MLSQGGPIESPTLISISSRYSWWHRVGGLILQLTPQGPGCLLKRHVPLFFSPSPTYMVVDHGSSMLNQDTFGWFSEWFSIKWSVWNDKPPGVTLFNYIRAMIQIISSINSMHPWFTKHSGFYKIHDPEVGHSKKPRAVFSIVYPLQNGPNGPPKVHGL